MENSEAPENQSVGDTMVKVPAENVSKTPETPKLSEPVEPQAKAAESKTVAPATEPSKPTAIPDMSDPLKPSDVPSAAARAP
jgi:hypothetical protein